MEERLMKKSQADEDDNYMFLMSVLPSIKKLDDIQTETQNRISEQPNQETSDF